MGVNCAGRRHSAAKTFVEEGVSSCCPDGPEAVLCSVLNDDATPGLVDRAELYYILRGKQSEATRDPPIVRRMMRLADTARDWCILEGCRSERRSAAREFAMYAGKRLPMLELPQGELSALHAEALAMKEEDDPVISTYGDIAAISISRALELSGRYAPMFEGAVVYVSPGYNLRVVDGMEESVEYWGAVYREPNEMGIFAPRFAKGPIRTVDLSTEIIGWREKFSEATVARKRRLAIEIRQDALNALLHCTPRKGRDGTNQGWACRGGKDTDYYMYKWGFGDYIPNAVVAYSRWQPYLEAIFARYDLPPFLATIAIIESGMRPGVVSDSGAAGPYQIMPQYAGHYGLYVGGDGATDERRNVLFAADAAAKILREARDAIMGRNFVEGVTFDKPLANLMATSAYHAGIGNLRRALRKAKAQLEVKKGKGRKSVKAKVTGEELFSYLLTTGFISGGFRNDSKDYPPQLYPAVVAVQDLPFARRMPIFRVSQINVGRLKKPLKLRELIELSLVSAEAFFGLNPQFDPRRESAGFSAGRGMRFLIPQIAEGRVSELLIERGYVDRERLGIDRYFDQKGLISSTMSILTGNARYVKVNSHVPVFVPRK